ncbi:MAG TPA: AlpA family phage regulatory protein [Gammaproteobacteria bacterium]|nr:AlpA family phage regulatory protein [Gammaproteobacteria bacterium]
MNNRNQAIKYGSQYVPEDVRACAPLIPDFGYLRLRHIIGDSKADPPIPAIFPISSSSWWNGIKKNLYPKPVKLSANCTAWRVEDIRDLINRINSEGETSIE